MNQAFECPRCGHCCREWVGLTNREIQEIADRIEVDDLLLKTPTWHIRFARAVQRKLKGKNT